MKLDNRGWGTKEMIFLSSILLLVLLFVAFSIYKLYHSVENIPSQYAMMEKNLVNYAQDYCKSNGKKSVITVNELINSGYFDFFTDINDNPCDGYVLTTSNEYNAYISCEYYRTNGYNSNYSN